MHTLLSRPVTTSHFTTHDGVSLSFRHWPALNKSSNGAVVLFHRGHEHGGRMEHIVNELEMADYDFFAWDARGHGASPGERGFSPSLADSVRDVQTFVDHIVTVYKTPLANISVIAQSVGAVIVSIWLHDYAPKIRAAVLASPAFEVRLYIPLAIPGLRFLRSVIGHFYVKSYVKAKMLTHDPERIKSFQEDMLISMPISVDILLQLKDTSKRIVADAQAIVTPIQLLISGKDYVVEQKPQHLFFERLGSEVKEKHVLEGFFHDTLGELERSKALGQVKRFLLERYAGPLAYPNLLEQHKWGYTYDEAIRLATPYPAGSWEAKYWDFSKKGMHYMGKVSEGIRLGHETGFDSGSTLDYVYRNKPTGKTFLGRFVDYNYLNSVGWTGIRQRKVNIDAMLKKAIFLLREAKKPVNVLDIAAGHGRYILEAITNSVDRPDSVLLRDYSSLNVEGGTALIAKLKLNSFVKFVKADAFDTIGIAQASPRPTLIVVSGLYELFPDNDLLHKSLDGISRALEEDCYLIYTCQPWHPQLELIARTLTSHRQGQSWVMRRRSQAEMDQLVESHGFEKVAQLQDAGGIFTVTLAKRGWDK